MTGVPLLRLLSLGLACLALLASPARAWQVTFEPGPDDVEQYGMFEVSVHVDGPVVQNPFTQASLRGDFFSPTTGQVTVAGFCDSPDGTLFTIRFCPQTVDAYSYTLVYVDGLGTEQINGAFSCVEPENGRPVVADPQHPHHFAYAGTEQHFYHLGITAYHLLMPENSPADIAQYVDWCADHGFNKVRFLLAGYASGGAYGAPPGLPTPVLPWPGGQGNLDFARFDVDYWQRAEAAIAHMRARGLVATVILMIEKDGLPRELGALSDNEKRYYAYAAARLAAFSNVWFDLGNEHNEYRPVPDWANEMGPFLRQHDPYGRLISAHGYADFAYGDQDWAGYIITQQYGNEQQVNQWALNYRRFNKPYVNEEFGYEGTSDEPGHGMNADWVRRCAWAIALAGGYCTYGDWLPDAPFYLGRIGEGKAPPQLRIMREFFEALPYWEMAPDNSLTNGSNFCLAKPGALYVVYAPKGGAVELDLTPAAGNLSCRWLNPRTGDQQEGPPLQGGARRTLTCPDAADWVLLVGTALPAAP